MSPTARTLAELRRRGYPLVQVVEHWNAFAKRRIDLFSIIDVLAVKDKEILAVQCTSGTNLPARLKKIRESAALPYLRTAGITVAVHGWRLNAKNRWTLREVSL